MTELKGYEEQRGPRRDTGSQHGVVEGRQTWLERKRQAEAELGYTTQPYCRDRRRRAGRHRPGCAAEAPGRADDHRRQERAPRRLRGASATSRSACTIRSGTTTCPTCRSPITGRSSRPRTRSATGWRCTPRSWSSTTGSTGASSAHVRRGAERVDGRRSSAPDRP